MGLFKGGREDLAAAGGKQQAMAKEMSLQGGGGGGEELQLATARIAAEMQVVLLAGALRQHDLEVEKAAPPS